MRDDTKEGGCWHSLKTSLLVLRPDMRGLVDKGFARFLGNPDDKPAPPIEFTEQGLDVLEKKATTTP